MTNQCGVHADLISIPASEQRSELLLHELLGRKEGQKDKEMMEKETL